MTKSKTETEKVTEEVKKDSRASETRATSTTNPITMTKARDPALTEASPSLRLLRNVP